jgi:hypothetical protein
VGGIFRRRLREETDRNKNIKSSLPPPVQTKKKEWGVPATLVVNGQTHNLRISPQSFRELQLGVGNIRDYRGYRGINTPKINITAQLESGEDEQDVFNNNKLRGFVRK